MLEFLLRTLHTRSPYDRTHHSHARCVHSHRPNASPGPRESSFGHIDGRGLAADMTRKRHGPSASWSSRMRLSTLRARAMDLISRGMEQNLRRSARATYLENAYGSATHRVLSDGAGMVDELGTRGGAVVLVVGRVAFVSCVAPRGAGAHLKEATQRRDGLCVGICDARRGTGSILSGSMIVLSIPRRLRAPVSASQYTPGQGTGFS